jgi:hypothetical protein
MHTASRAALPTLVKRSAVHTPQPVVDKTAVMPAGGSLWPGNIRTAPCPEA